MSKFRFDVDAVRKLAGDKSFDHSLVCHRDGQVELVLIEPGRVTAIVSGGENYRVELAGTGKKIGGECSCPAFVDPRFCKHMVATALTANNAEESAAASTAMERIRRHLAANSSEQLIELIVGLAQRDDELLRELDIAAVMASDDAAAVEARLRRAIDSATTIDGYVHYREVRDWAGKIEKVLENVSALVAEGRAALALSLASHALHRIDAALGSIDDSAGHGGGLLYRASEIHVEACRIARPDPVVLAADLFRREMTQRYDVLSGTVQSYADALGEMGLAEYRRLAAEAWEKLPPIPAGRRAAHDYSPERSRLESILDFFAARDGDVEAQIAIRAKNLSSPFRYLDLAKFCLEHGRLEEALRHAEEGLWMFEDDRPDERLVGFAADLLSKAGRNADADALLWRTFERSPSLHLYEKLPGRAESWCASEPLPSSRRRRPRPRRHAGRILPTC